MLNLSHRLAGREDALDVEAERGGELEARQDQGPLQQAAVFLEPALLLLMHPAELLEELELVDLLLHAPISGDRVVIGEGDRVQAARLAPVQEV